MTKTEKTKFQEKAKLHISVRNLVEFIFREGDIDSRMGRLTANAMAEGSRMHRRIQKSMGEGYQAEVPLSETIEENDYLLTVEGRADGILQADGLYYIDEIKGIYRRLATLKEPVYVHKAQALCYAYIFAGQKGLDRIGVQMTYCDLDRGARMEEAEEGLLFSASEEIKRFREVYTWEELSVWFANLMEQYRRWAEFQVKWKQKRQASIRGLEFPYPYRAGQKELVRDVYRTIMRGKTLFLQAPTGVGKTISTLFPAVKAVGEELAERIFYLTAKTITATVAKETIALLRQYGYTAKTIQLTAKEKLCLCPNEEGEPECDPLRCPYAKGHYDRVNDAVYDLLMETDLFTREEILAKAGERMVCPFEMSLDVAAWADNILCDYNYVFDPDVCLKRFFAEGAKGDYIFLVDEAHNLVERSREMYSAELVKEDFLAVKRALKEQKNKRLEGALERCNKDLLAMKRECADCHVYADTGALVFHLMRLAGELEDFLEKPMDIAARRCVTGLYFQVRKFLNIYDLADARYVIYGRLTGEGKFILKLYCVDPSANLQNCIDKAKATVFFSATLLPVDYYKKLLSTREDNYAVYAQSSFDPAQQLLLFGRGVSTKYTRRGPAEYQKIAAYIYAAVQGRQGNYMAFFPSYKVMQEVSVCFEETVEARGGGIDLLRQSAGMKEDERELFLAAFDEARAGTLVAFCVMGGIFSEGIDLKNDRLIGAVIVGTGLPQVSGEREILRKYYEEKGFSGFDYAFRYPGMNKVLQAAGRVIRTAEDRGVVLLLDDRFLQPDYEPLFPREWRSRQIGGMEQIAEWVRRFWEA